jgi:hypothetical protein
MTKNQMCMTAHSVFIGQHATATCCRGCLWKWHRIERVQPLTEEYIRFMVELVMGWIADLPPPSIPEPHFNGRPRLQKPNLPLLIF